ncbi:hypothetical protein HN954_03455 [bacterium]|jgi:hypothetical protein|nr:hypothetical protein [bacterium]MBT6832234.1 hypothetical protein [bacterium]MBT6996459.1 hypothetical protein [bacterium]MBT7772294.1 hypothetical protein [bacterium]
MIKIINRLLILVVIIGGIWFLAKNWNTEEPLPTKDEPVATEEISKESDKMNELKDSLSENLPETKDYEASEPEEVVSTPIVETAEPEIVETQKPATTVIKNPTTPKIETPVTPIEEIVVEENPSYVRVYLYEWEIDLTDRTLARGPVTFEVLNNGRFAHYFSIDGVKDFGKVLPGTSVEFTVNLAAGNYEITSPREIDMAHNMRENFVVED